MKNIKIWLGKNWGMLLIAGVFVVLLVSPDAKAWVMRQLASTGLLNSKIEAVEKAETSEGVESLPDTTAHFSVRDEKGTTISTAELKGKVVFINFWASWCPPCRAEFPSIQKFYEKYHGKVVFLTVNMDHDLAAGKKYLHEEHFSVPFLIPEGQIPPSFFSGALPTTVILDKGGNIRMSHPGLGDYSTVSFYRQIDALLSE